jgi:hypothetical protein
MDMAKRNEYGITKRLDMHGDTLEVMWTGSVWQPRHLVPALQCGSAREAMRAELHAYLLSCGETPSERELTRYLRRME